MAITLITCADSSGKHKFTSTEEKTAKGILFHVGVLADIVKELTPAQQALVTPEIEAAIQEMLDDNADNFAQIVRGAYVKIESTHFVREEEDEKLYDTALDSVNWPVRRAYAAVNGMLVRVATDSKVITKEQAESFWPVYTAKKVIRRVRKA